jgi:arylsulfatase A-like enzyme
LKLLVHLSKAIAFGLSAGLVSFVCDDLLAVATLGYWIPILPNYPLTYVISGAGISLLVAAAAQLVRRATLSTQTLFALTFALLCVPSIIERGFSTLEFRTSTTVAAVGALLAAAAFGLWLALLVRLTPEKRRTWPLLAGALTAMVGMAVNRNLVDLPISLLALMLDLMILVAGCALAISTRWVRPRIPMSLAALALLATLVSTLLPARISVPETDTPGADHPNLVLIVIDTLRQDVFHSVVEETEEGRLLQQQLADAGWFSNLIAAAPWTAPSVGSIMTGLYPPEHGFGRSVRDPGRPLRRLADQVPTLAEHLAGHGYLNVGVVTNNLLHPHSGISRGFHHYELLIPGAIKLPLVTTARKLGLGRPELYQQAGSVRHLLARRIDRVTAVDRPLFLWLHLMDPHAPLHEHQELEPGHEESESERLDRLYHQESRYVVGETAAMLELLRSKIDWGNTVVVLVADHGEMLPSDNHDNGVIRFGEKMLYGHGHALYEELVNVPLVIRPKGGIKEGRRVDVMASQVDLLDTILDLLDVDTPRTGKGRFSLATWLGPQVEEKMRRRRYALIGATQHGPKHRAFRNSRFKLIHYPGSERSDEVYSLKRDQREQRDLRTSQPERWERLLKRLSYRWKKQIKPLKRGKGPLDPEAQQRLKALGYLEE